MRNATTVVRDAIKNTPQDYLMKTYAMRAGLAEQGGHNPERAGSYFPRFKPSGVKNLISTVVWEPYTHPNIQEPAQGFIARSFPSRMGMVHIEDVPADVTLVLSDPKDTGKVECIWKGAPANKGHKVDFLVALVGPGDNGKDVLWTFFPGDPIHPSTVERQQPCSHCNGGGTELDGERGPCLRCDGTKVEDLEGALVDRERAKALGIQWVKPG